MRPRPPWGSRPRASAAEQPPPGASGGVLTSSHCWSCLISHGNLGSHPCCFESRAELFLLVYNTGAA